MVQYQRNEHVAKRLLITLGHIEALTNLLIFSVGTISYWYRIVVTRHFYEYGPDMIFFVPRCKCASIRN